MLVSTQIPIGAYHTLEIRIFPTEGASLTRDEEDSTYPVELNIVNWRNFARLDRIYSNYLVESDPDKFREQFGNFYWRFKRHYDSEDWVDENTSCRQISPSLRRSNQMRQQMSQHITEIAAA